MAARASYRHAGLALIRATTDSGGLELPDDVDVFGEAVVEQGRAWLARTWQRGEVRQAVQLASPALCKRIQQTLEERPDARQMRRVVLSLASYILRWRGRATPFGLFAGVAVIDVGRTPMVRWGREHRAVAQADATWLGALINDLERNPGLLERLPVVVNNTAYVRGDRLVISGQPSDTNPGQVAPEEISVRFTGLVRTAVQAAREPLPFGELAKWLCAEHPAATPEQVRAMLAALVARHILVTVLRAPMSAPEPLRHVHTHLRTAVFGQIHEAAELTAQLTALQNDLSRLSSVAVPDIAQEDWTGLVDRMRAVSGTAGQSLAVDVSLDCNITLPGTVFREAERAAATLLRLTPYPFGFPHWKDFHVRFKARYGINAVVPLRDLVADSGLGLPAGYIGSPYGTPARALTERDHTLLALVQHAMLDGREEIVLTEDVISALTVGDQDEVLPPPYAELVFQLHAPSLEAVSHGAFGVAVVGTPRSSSSMAGRFTHLLPDHERDRLSRLYQAVSDDDAVAVQLSFPPRRRSSENVARTPQLLRQMISLAEHRHPGDRGVIAVDDLAVTADAREMHLLQLSTGRRIEPRVLHALEAGVLTPPLARFLAEVTMARRAVYTAFDWGAAARLPYLPRLRCGRTILSAARWRLTADDLPAQGTAWPDWDQAFQAWRRRLGVPSTIVLCESEQRLPLNLAHDLHRALLRTRLERARQVELREAPDPSDLAWLGRAHEILVPLLPAPATVAGNRSDTRKPRPTARRVERTTERWGGHLPGFAPVLYAQIGGHPARQNEILIDYLPSLFDAWNEQPFWWFSRHRDMTRPTDERYLEMYVRLSGSDDYGAAAARVGRWAADLRDRGLVPHLRLGTYHPETGRFGHGQAATSAEDVFAADSAAALAQLALATRIGISARALAAASMVDLASSYAETPTRGLNWLIDQLPHQARPGNALRDQAVELANPFHEHATMRALPGGDDVVETWNRRRKALTTYRTHLADQREPFSTMRSLLHLHHVRCLGRDPEGERVSNSLARAAALSQLARSHLDQQ
ncbi:lantibiotic dehydratase [Actinomadura sp. 3N508]|uniref:lantibiotic dehydratase n=1 Tax=Actinomadura sp. 3N508 TaxID=3375153 RepID=UPI0037B55139